MKKQLYTKKLLALTLAIAIATLSLLSPTAPSRAEPTDGVIARQQARLAMNIAAANVLNNASKKPTSGAQ